MSEEYERYSLDIAKYILIALQILGGNASRQEIKEKFVEDTQFDLTYHEVFEPYTGKTYSHFLFDFNFGLIALKCCNYIEPYQRNSNIILTQKGKNFNAQLYPTDEDKEIQQDYWQKAHNKKSNEQAFINWCTNHKQLKNSNKLYSESSAKDFTFMLKKQLCKKIPEIEKEINSQNIFIITDYELIDAILNKYLSEIDNIDKLANNADGKNSLILYSEFLKGNNCENPIEQLETYNKGDNMESAKYHPLNQILYGPPGTGKTYNTVIKAMEIITFENLFRKWFIEIYCKNKNVKDSEKTLKDYVTHIKKINEEYLINDNIFKYYDIASFKQLQTNILNSSYVLKNDTRNNPNSYYQHSLKRYEEFLYWLDYEKIRKEFDALKQQGQIEFVTFHQSYSYEEFVEGIKPDISKWNDDGSELKYVGKDGIFKNICEHAKPIKVSSIKHQPIDFSNTKVFKMSLGNTLEKEDDIYEYCISNDVVALGFKDIDFSDCKTSQDFKDKDDSWGATALERFINWMDVGDIIIISNGNKNFRAIAQVTGNYYYDRTTPIRYSHFRKVEWLYKGEDIYYSKINNKVFSQQSIYGYFDPSKKGMPNYNPDLNTQELNNIITGKVDKEIALPHILIIDEINRGNISKIFGELITLIEEDKRGSLSVRLPYSQDDFTVPQNLYIIGTMNTSDRSIASIDIALRRRFKFVEMMPKPEVLINENNQPLMVEDINLQNLLKTINERISYILDRDHQIGHSYFMNWKNYDMTTLKNVWFDEIIPLLNEYFYSDWDKLQAILGKANEIGAEKSFIVKIKKPNLPYEADCSDEEAYYNFSKKEETNDDDFKMMLKNAILI